MYLDFNMLPDLYDKLHGDRMTDSRGRILRPPGIYPIESHESMSV